VLTGGEQFDLVALAARGRDIQRKPDQRVSTVDSGFRAFAERPKEFSKMALFNLGAIKQNLTNLPARLKNNITSLPGELAQNLTDLPGSFVRNVSDFPNAMKRRAIEAAEAALNDTSTPVRPPALSPTRSLPPVARPEPLPTPSTMPGMSPMLDAPPPPPRRALLSPGGDPNAPIPAPNIRPAAPPAPSPREARLPEFNPGISRSDEFRGARDEIVGKRTGRVKGILLGAGLGALRGLATGQGLGAGLGGAVAGALTGGISPKTARQQQFDMLRKPQMMERWQLEDMDTARARQAASAALDDQHKRAQIGVMESQGIRNQAEAERALRPPTPPRQPAAQMKLGRNTRTGQIDYYNPGDPTQSADFEPYQFPRENRNTPRNAPRQSQRAVGQLNQINKLKREAAKAWQDWGNITDPEKKRKAAARAGAAQGAYNDAVRVLGETFPDEFETGGFTEQNGNQGWSYYKPRQGAQAQGGVSSRPQGQRKARVGPDFIQHVVNTLGVSPEKARQMIIDDGYEINDRR
jgi:hypothetical protein